MAGPGNPSVYLDTDLNVKIGPPKGTCGCDETKSLYRSVEQLAAVGLKLQAEKERLFADLIDCERKLAEMTRERDDHRRAGEHVTRQFLKATGREPK